MRFNPAKFDQQINKQIDAIRLRLKKVTLEAADYAMERLANQFSPVWTGTYILSHRVGINGMTDSGYTNKIPPGLAPGDIPPKVSAGEIMAYRITAAGRVKSKISIRKMPDSGRLVIYNQSPMAMHVETLPDKYLTGDMNPYHPYRKTKMALFRKLPEIIERVK